MVTIIFLVIFELPTDIRRNLRKLDLVFFALLLLFLVQIGKITKNTTASLASKAFEPETLSSEFSCAESCQFFTYLMLYNRRTRINMQNLFPYRHRNTFRCLHTVNKTYFNLMG